LNKRNFIIIIILLILSFISANIVYTAQKERVIVIITDESNKSIRDKSDKLIKRLLEVREKGKLGQVPDLREKFKKYDFNNKQEKKAFEKFGIKGDHLPVLALMYIDKMGYPKKILWKTKVDKISKAVSELGQHLAKIPATATKLTPPDNPEKEREMIDAVKSGNIDKVKKMLSQDPNLAISRDDGSKGHLHKGKTPLHWAAFRGNEEMILLLISAGADVNAKDKLGITPLNYAISAVKNKAVVILVQNKADVNIGDELAGETPLHRAAARGSKRVIKLLIDKGALIDSRNKAGETPLIFAVRKGKKDAVLTLLEESANVNAKDKKQLTPLHHACGGMKDNEQIAGILISKGADINAKNIRGLTPLHIAVFKGHKNIVRFLIKSGADVNAKGDMGITPLKIAKKMKKTEIVEILEKAGAKR